MNWNESPDFQQLMAEYTDLEKNAEHREQFEAFLSRMWAVPEDYSGLLQAYLEFVTPEKPQYRRLNDPELKKPESDATPEKEKSRSSRRRRRGGRRRSRRRSKKSTETSQS